MRWLRPLLGLAGAAAIAVGVDRLFERGLASFASVDAGAGAHHLAAQKCEDASLALELTAEPVELRGVLRARMTAGGPIDVLALVLGDSVVVESVKLGGQWAAARTGVVADLVAQPRALARFFLADGVATPADLEVKFRAAVDGANLPALLEPTRLVRVVEPMRLSTFAFELPAGGALVGVDSNGARAQFDAGRHVLGNWDDAREPLLIGAAEWRNGVAGLASQRFIAARGLLPDATVETAARVIVEHALGEKTLPPRTLVLLTGGAARGFPHRDGGWCAAPLPRNGPELALALLEAAAPADPGGDELARALPAALTLQGMTTADEAPPRAAAQLTVPPSQQAGLRAWLALESAFGERAHEAARELWRTVRDGGTTRPALLEESAAKAVVAWALAGADVQLEGLRLDATGDHIALRGHLSIEPPPPAGVVFATSLVYVGDSRIQVERLLIGGARTALPTVALQETPLQVAVDPRHLLPRLGGADAIFPLDYAPTTFAIAADVSSLALAVSRARESAGDGSSAGVFVLESGSDSRFALQRWTPTAAPSTALSWILPRRFLALESDRVGTAARGGTTVLSLNDGALDHYDERLLISPRGGIFITESERAPGCFTHVVHDLKSGVERPLTAPRRAPVRWVRGADEVVAEAEDGRAVVIDLRGRELFRMPWLASSVSDVRRTSFGYALVIEALDVSRLVLLRPDGERVEQVVAPGRVRSWTFIGETGFFYLVAEAGPRAYVVARARFGGGRAVELYRGSDRPLAEGLTQKGVVLVAADGDVAAVDEPRRLLFLPFDAEGEAERSARLLCAEAFLTPAPVLASAGRYLYYFRAKGGPRGLAGAQRPRALQRFDFLTGREEAPTIEPR